jgi:hypothetical protein
MARPIPFLNESPAGFAIAGVVQVFAALLCHGPLLLVFSLIVLTNSA